MSDGHHIFRGATIVGAEGRADLDLEVRGGKVVALHPRTSPAPAGAREVDVRGQLLMPGMVDTHVHFMEPGDPTREDFPSGSAAAACAGVTTVVEHTHGRPVTDVESLVEKRAALAGRSHVDYGLVAHVWPDRLGDLPALWREGIVYFKAFTCATHGVPAIKGEKLIELARTVAELEAPCLVHSEDDAITAANERALRAAGRHDGGVIPVWRSAEAERVSTGEVAGVARETGARLIVAHVSNAGLLELLARERGAGSRILAECCPQYLNLWEREVVEFGAFRKFTPPARIRSAADEQRMWDAFNEGLVHHLSSDHAPSTAAQKRDGDIWDVHFGLPGIDTTMPLMLDAALRGRTTLERVAEAYALRPAQVYGLAGKGSLSPGDDADLVLIDPDGSWEVRDEDIHSLARWSPYSGRTLRGRVVATYLRGEEIARDRTVRGDRRGEWLPGAGSREVAAEVSEGRPARLAKSIRGSDGNVD